MEQQEGKTVVTIRDVAQRAGVAVSTASRALSGGSASEATRRKVQEAAEALHFVPNPAARRLTGGHSNVVALVVDEPTDFLFRDDFLAGILGQLSMSLARENLLPFLILAEPDNTPRGLSSCCIAPALKAWWWRVFMRVVSSPICSNGSISPPCSSAVRRRASNAHMWMSTITTVVIRPANCWWNAAAGTLPLSRGRAICPRRRNVRPDSVPR